MPTELYRRVFENNLRWVQSRTEADPEFFVRLSKDQTPQFLYIGCADSRVPANEIMGLEPGDVVVHRNIANLVVNTDVNAQSLIQYAVDILEVKHIVVCGHYGCGGVRAATQQADLGVLNLWLREIRDLYRANYDELEALEGDERHRRLVELNVQHQCINVIKTACVQRHWMRHHFPTVHGWVYDLKNGVLKDLNLDFAAALDNIRRVYRLEP